MSEGVSEAGGPAAFPRVLSMRRRAEAIHRILKERLDTVLPAAMREAGLDMWIVVCQEDDDDPVFRTLIPMDTWCPILQILVFCDRGEREGVERINISMTDTRGLYDCPWTGRDPEEQWALLRRIVEERKPRRIGVDIGEVQWAAGGLTHVLHRRLVDALPPACVERLASAEPLIVRWLATRTRAEMELHEHVVGVAHALLAACYSRRAITPGSTTVDDLVWSYWQRCADLGLAVAFKPFFFLVRSEAGKERYGEDDRIIRPGDFVRSDVGIRYLGLHSDHQQWAYVLRPGENDAPRGMRALLAEGNRLQDIFMETLARGRTGNELLRAILARAREAGIPKPRVYSHSLGPLLHEPGPLIGLPWEQEGCPGRGDVALEDDTAFAMELSVTGPVPEWGGQEVTLGLEEDVVFTGGGCRPLDGRQTAFYLLRG